ncbi:alkylation response protein AidB-like acyl-CoA dehydrogenase [Streptacidiphilus sp. MAP12-16]|uniref:acyl-CoA dehydrogenase family protein n=1 Tax=Streptacidiphilus sp. MAP12-16 TaxID=3156300 RepID=UPI003514D2D2
MDPALTPEQEAVRRTLREALAKRCGPEEVRAAAASPLGYDPELWHRLAEQLGLPGLALPEQHGGAGLGAVELALACEEAGRVLLPSPLLASSVLAATVVRALGTDEQQAALLPRLASGERTAALVLAAAPALGLGLVPDRMQDGLPDGTPAGGGRAGGVQARPVDQGWLLYGEAGQVLDGARADLLVVAAHTGGFPRSRTVLFLVDPADGGATGLTRSRLATLDDTRSLGRVELRDVRAVPLGDPDCDAAPALARTGLLAAVAVAAEAVGAAEQCLTRTVEYVQVRKQFGRAVGSFQAVKHRLADVYVAVETARSAVHYAAWALRNGGADGVDSAEGPDRPDGADEQAAAAPLALAAALGALRTASAEAIQLHGGIAITWEHDAHLYFKRATADELLFGPPHLLRARAAERAALFGPAGRPDGRPHQRLEA